MGKRMRKSSLHCHVDGASIIEDTIEAFPDEERSIVRKKLRDFFLDNDMGGGGEIKDYEDMEGWSMAYPIDNIEVPSEVHSTEKATLFSSYYPNAFMLKIWSVMDKILKEKYNCPNETYIYIDF